MMTSDDPETELYDEGWCEVLDKDKHDDLLDSNFMPPLEVSN